MAVGTTAAGGATFRKNSQMSLENLSKIGKIVKFPK